MHGTRSAAVDPLLAVTPHCCYCGAQGLRLAAAVSCPSKSVIVIALESKILRRCLWSDMHNDSSILPHDQMAITVLQELKLSELQPCFGKNKESKMPLTCACALPALWSVTDGTEVVRGHER